MKTNIYASSFQWENKGILIIGESGSGKSDLCLRFILNKKALLIADDRTELSVSSKGVLASCPTSIKGLLEVRGIGIKKVPFCEEGNVDLVVELISAPKGVDRLPEKQFWEFSGVKLPLIKIWSGDISVVEKIIAALQFENA